MYTVFASHSIFVFLMNCHNGNVILCLLCLLLVLWIVDGCILLSIGLRMNISDTFILHSCLKLLWPFKMNVNVSMFKIFESSCVNIVWLCINCAFKRHRWLICLKHQSYKLIPLGISFFSIFARGIILSLHVWIFTGHFGNEPNSIEHCV